MTWEEKVNDEELINIYRKAKETNVDETFIYLVLSELRKRGVHLTDDLVEADDEITKN
ncbi:sporulation histidine kinase inhibitor Sda [Metabacillus fastidiosus]|uniref:Sporulation histidine kinase inhibitor Sda n=1 Tax=Metabacillus fastidiosus TaxID=1458 RepID=A0ABU6NTA9_9BACI|nr:sporulation histidine kinase inhibitor Sda [Metabacillus fastidiosus]MEC2075568.1 sporulation histidine kinase inhibitor Sda [Metabacillus fastidiosus]MED4400385.1 sporulation histidine kinase inhibitor Sda [Metabacillus fastidiosus]MED4464269.1 sporulation histidine kinase inhibitor Sda [Metabacillus fastidiosus]MED4531130.1 sporulation histidine kinase inhibitor Sda [Metabacillus fastidiosus]